MTRHGGRFFEARRRFGRRDVLDLSANLNPLGFDPGLKNALMKKFEDAAGHYPDEEAAGIFSSLAEFYATFSGEKRRLFPDEFALGAGTTHLMEVIAHLYRNRRFLLVQPLFSEVEAPLVRLGVRRKNAPSTPENHFQPPLDFIEKNLRRNDIQVLTNPTTPGGNIIPIETIRKLLALCQKRGAILLIDEAYMPFCEKRSSAVGLSRNNLIVLLSLTKLFSTPGLRIGALWSNPKTVSALRAGIFPWAVGGLEIEAAVHSLKSGFYLKTPSKTAMLRKKQMDLARKAVRGKAEVYDSDANYFLIRFNTLKEADAFQKKLEKDAILTRRCGDFFGLDDRFVRLSVWDEAAHKRLLKALSR